MMVTERSHFVDQIKMTQHLNKISDQIEALTKHYQDRSQQSKVPQDIQAILPDLTECSQLIENKKISSNDPELNQSVGRFLKSLKDFPFHIENDKSTQEKVNAIQVGLFSNFVKYLTKLEANLKKWRIGTKVEGTNKGGTASGGQS